MAVKKKSTKISVKKVAPKKAPAKKATKAEKAAPKAEKKPVKPAKAVKIEKKPLKAGKKSKESKEPAERWKRKTVAYLLTKSTLTAAQTSLIKKLDKLEMEILDSKDKFQEGLKELHDSLGGRSSFNHPERGPFSVMKRGEYFWRKKPDGKAA